MILLRNKTNVISPNSTYPYGAIKDNPGDGTGTPVNTSVYGDMHQFLEKLFANSGLTANGLADNASNGFQLFEAFITSGNINFVADFITAYLGSYTTNDLIVLWGCNVSVIGSTYTITDGAIFYNKQIYKVTGSSVTLTGSNSMVYKIDTSVQPNTIYIANAAANSGIANYGDSTVKNRNLPNNFIKASTKTTSASITTVESTILTLTPSTTQSSAKISISFYMNWQSSATGDDVYNITVKKNGVAIQGAMLHSTTAGFKHDHNSFYETSYTAGDVITVTVYTNNYSSSLNYAILKAESFDCNF